MKRSGIFVSIVLLAAAGSLLIGQNITVLQPPGGADLKLGDPFQITWTESGLPGGHIVIQLYEDNNQLGHISYHVPLGQQSFDWQVGQLVHNTVDAGSHYRIRVRLYDSPTWDFSGIFTISEDSGTKLPPRQIRGRGTPYHPDLQVTLSHQPADPKLGDRLELTATVKNIGTGNSQPCHLRFKLGSLDLGGLQEVTALGGNQQIEKRAHRELDRMGTYYFKAELVNSTDNNRRNNEARVSITPGLPDLVFTEVIRSDSDVGLQQKVRVSATVKNIGDAKAGPFHIQMRWERCKGLAQTWPKHRVVLGLNPGESVQVAFSTRFACNRRKVNTIRIDPGNEVMEKNENNNCSPRIVITVHLTQPKYSVKNTSIPIID